MLGFPASLPPAVALVGPTGTGQSGCALAGYRNWLDGIQNPTLGSAMRAGSRVKAFTALSASLLSPLACRRAGAGASTCQGAGVLTVLPASGPPAPARSIQPQREATGD